MKEIKISEQFLIKEYIKNKKSYAPIAKIIGCSIGTIGNKMKKYGVQPRNPNLAKILTKSFLIKEYIEKQKSCYQIAKEVGCTPRSVLLYLKKLKIKIRTSITANAIKYSKILTEDFLYTEYITNKKSTLKIAKEIKHSINFVRNNMIKYNIKPRRLKDAIALKDNKGKKNPMYGKITHGKRGYYKQSYMRSSWEVAYARYCIINHIKYRYEPKAFEITYKYKGEKKEGTYRPDFYLPETNEYIEIKGWWRDKGKAKFNAFKKQYHKENIKVLMKSELERLEIGL